MSALLFTIPVSTVFDSNGAPEVGATATFYLSGTTTKTPIYSDGTLTTVLPNPVTANGAGQVPTIYLDRGIKYRVVVKDVDGVTIKDLDPYVFTGTTAEYVVESFEGLAGLDLLGTPASIITRGHRAGSTKGGATYVYDATVNSTFVAAHPGWSVMAANNRGYRLSTDQDIKLSMFGARRVLSGQFPQTDVTPYWLKAKDFLHFYRDAAQGNPYYKAVLPIQFDELYYYASAAFDLTDGVYHIKGMGNGSIGCTSIFMQGGQCGFLLQSWDTAGVNGFKTNTPSGASYSIIEDIAVEGNAEDLADPNRDFPNMIVPGPRNYITAPSSLLGNELHCGFLIKCPAKLVRCKARYFGGWGIAIRADVNVGGNANLCVLENCEASYNWGGLLLSGGDANAFEISGMNCAGNITYGIWDKSFLGGRFSGGHLQGNGSGQWNAGPFWLDFNPTTGAWVSGTALRKAALVNYAGQTYRLMPGQAVAGATTVPGTNSAVWTPYGAYDDFAHPRYSTWVSGITSLTEGGAMYISDINNKSNATGFYMEYDQPLGKMHALSRASAFGAFSSWDNGNFLNAVNGEFWSKGTFRVGGEVQQTTRMTALGFRFCDNDENHLTYWEWTSHDLAMSWNLTRPIMCITGDQTAKTFGRSTPLKDAVQIVTPVLGTDANARVMTFSSAAPTTGAWAVGDTVINNGLGATTIATTNMWRCTVAGTPGTWVAKA